MNWPPVFHLQWLGHVPYGRHHLPTTIVWNSPMQELIGSVMVSSLLLPAFGTLSLLLFFQLPSAFLPSKGRSITTLGTRWHDFFYYPFRYFINLFCSFHCLYFPFLRDADSRKGTLCLFCVPIQKKKKKKWSKDPPFSYDKSHQMTKREWQTAENQTVFSTWIYRHELHYGSHQSRKFCIAALIYLLWGKTRAIYVVIILLYVNHLWLWYEAVPKRYK